MQNATPHSLFTEGIVDSADEIELIHLCEYSTQARVLLKEPKDNLKAVGVQLVPSCCTGNITFGAVESEQTAAPERVKPISWKPEWMFKLANLFAQDTPVHKRTFGSHSCFLAVGGEVLYCCEDLGRHNAFDKVIGMALLNGIDLTQAMVYSSGRLPVDMVTKAIRAGIPILVSKAVPTNLTVQLAREYDLILICQARPDSMKVYNDPTE